MFFLHNSKKSSKFAAKKKMEVRFSVIMPLYNKARYVLKALESVCGQTCAEWECIVVDDGSTDDSQAEVQSFCRAHSQYPIRLIAQSNAGVAAARNAGVAASKGEFVCFLDADDWWEPTFLDEMKRLTNAYPEAGLYATNYIYFKPGKTHVALDWPTGYMDYPAAYLANQSMPVTSITACMPRRVFDEMGGFPKGITLGEDFLFWARTAMRYKLAFCAQPLAYYNNDVPAGLRATRNIHKPEQHMLFHLSELEKELVGQRGEWKQLLDRLRVDGLMDYWLSDEYHDAAAKELAKVDWTQQPMNRYAKPVWWLKTLRTMQQIGSYCKQKLIRLWL